MKRAVIGAAALCFFALPGSAEIFENYCIGTAQDSPDACACGQVVADDLMSRVEQEVLVRLLDGESADDDLASLGLSRSAFDEKARAWDQGMVAQCYS